MKKTVALIPGANQARQQAMLGCYMQPLGMVSGVDLQTWFDQETRAGFAIVSSGNKSYLLYVPADRRPGELLCLDREGRVWLGHASVTAREFQVEEVPTSHLEKVDTQAIHRAHGGKVTLALEVEVHLGDKRRWVALERMRLPPAYGAWPVWEKQAPVAWNVRLVLIRDRSQTTLLPLGRR